MPPVSCFPNSQKTEFEPLVEFLTATCGMGQLINNMSHEDTDFTCTCHKQGVSQVSHSPSKCCTAGLMDTSKHSTSSRWVKDGASPSVITVSVSCLIEGTLRYHILTRIFSLGTLDTKYLNLPGPDVHSSVRNYSTVLLYSAPCSFASGVHRNPQRDASVKPKQCSDQS